MKIVYFGFNALSSCLDYLIQSQHDVVAVYCESNSPHTSQIIELAESNNIKLVFDKPTEKALKELINNGVDCFICAEYPHKIPLTDQVEFALNIHPTLLPEGRGKTPVPWLILKYPQHSGITLHKMDEIIDNGDVLTQQIIEVAENETFDSLMAKMFILAPQLLDQVLTDLPNFYQNSEQQTHSSEWPSINIEQQTIDWNMNVKEINLRLRAFGSLGVKTSLGGQDYYLSQAQGLEFQHQYNNSDVIKSDDYVLVIACEDGLVVIPTNALFLIN